jgi:hypothetical protein
LAEFFNAFVSELIHSLQGFEDCKMALECEAELREVEEAVSYCAIQQVLGRAGADVLCIGIAGAQ